MKIASLQSFLLYSIPLFLFHPLTRKSRIFVLKRFIQLQALFLIKRDCLIIVPWIKHLMLPLRKGDTGLSGNYYFGLHEVNDMCFLLHFLRSNDRFADIGSNLGSYSLLSAGLCGAKVVAVEASPETFSQLKFVIRLNELSSKVDCYNVALSSNSSVGSHVSFSVDLGSCNRIVSPDYEGKSVLVPVTNLDSIVSDQTPSLLKIDVEGHELSVLEGSTKTLSSPYCHAAIIEGTSDKVIRLLNTFGFVEVCYDPYLRIMKLSTEVYSMNHLWVKKNSLDYVQARLSSAQHLDIYRSTI